MVLVIVLDNRAMNELITASRVTKRMFVSDRVPKQTITNEYRVAEYEDEAP